VSWLDRAATAVGSAAVVQLARRSLDAAPPGSHDRWARTNHRGEQVTLLEGPAVAAGLVAGSLLSGQATRRARLATAAAVSTVAVVGCYDDLWGSASTKGLRGHLTALRSGEVTSGSVKVGVIGLTGLATARAIRPGAPVIGTLLDGALIAGVANLVNLLDLRPGRALKASLATAVLASASPVASLAAPVVGAAAGALPADLKEESMLGDCGANAVGAALGCALVAGASRPSRLAALAGIVALTLASEKISFSDWIDAHPVATWLDRLGRRQRAPEAPPAGSGAPAPLVGSPR
jgi:UDP-N-acetylmuramyl pentapeptide phosphotransferase/UDP-N-acetylglucosamine-1-phosphate transferase